MGTGDPVLDLTEALSQYIIQQHGNELAVALQFLESITSIFVILSTSLVISKASRASNICSLVVASIHGSQAGKGLLFR